MDRAARDRRPAPDSERIETRLRRLAEKATPGRRIVETNTTPKVFEWRIWTKARGNTDNMPENGDISGIVVSGMLWEQDAAFIAALSPSVVLRLVKVVEAARKALNLRDGWSEAIEGGADEQAIAYELDGEIDEAHEAIRKFLAALDAASEPQSEPAEAQR